jgi:hypothetical protein
VKRLLPALVLATAVPGTAAAAPVAKKPTPPKPPLEVTPGAPVATPSFAVRYTGTSHVKTRYRSQPPNPGGHADSNRVLDSSHQRWALDFPAGLTLPDCGADPAGCEGVRGPTVANGKQSSSGRIDHVHVDGLYDDMDSQAHCSVQSKHVRTKGLPVWVEVRHDAAAGAFTVTTHNPLRDALAAMPSRCPKVPDSLDLILDNYFAPGFTLGPGYREDIWYTTAAVSIPDATWRASSRIRLRLGPSAAGTPPANCAPRFAYEQCRTTSGWSGTLTFTRR